MKGILALAVFLLLAMPSWAEDRIAQSAAIRIPVGPFLSNTDFLTPQTSLTVTSLTVLWFQPPQYGTIANQVVNGTFATNTIWTVGAGCSITGGALSCTAATSVTTQQITCIQNVAYRVKVTATRTAGSFVVSAGGGTAGASHSTSDTFTDVVVCGGTGLISLTFTGFSGTIDDVEVEQWPMTIAATASGGANDMVHRASGVYELELTAAQAAIPGTHHLYFVDPASYAPLHFTIEVDASTGLACFMYGNCTGVAGIWAAATSGLTSAGSIGKLLSDYIDAAISSRVAATTVGSPAGASVSADIAAIRAQTNTLGTPATGSLATDIAAVKNQTTDIEADTQDLQARVPYVARKGIGFPWPMEFVLTTDGVTAIGAGIQPVCTVSRDSVNAFGASSNAPSATTALGLSQIVLSSADMNADSYVILSCTATGAIRYRTVFKMQTP